MQASNSKPLFRRRVFKVMGGFQGLETSHLCLREIEIFHFFFKKKKLKKPPLLTHQIGGCERVSLDKIQYLNKFPFPPKQTLLLLNSVILGSSDITENARIRNPYALLIR